MDDAALQRIAAWLARTSGTQVAIRDLERLSGGALQENWGFLLIHPDGREERMVLRCDAIGGIPSSRTRAEEYHVLRVAHAAGVAVAEPIALCTDSSVLGGPFFLMRRLAGVADPRRLVRDDALIPDRAAFGAALGTQLARIHAIRPPQPELGFLPPLPPNPAAARIAALRERLDRLAAPAPAIEWVLRRLEVRCPPPTASTLVHGDYRTGNIMVAEQRIAAVLDWEFAEWGDPDEDIGWFCARCWRFGRLDREAGGVAARADFYRGYQALSRHTIAPEKIRYWEATAAIRWAIIALEQGERHRAEQKPGLEAALTGRMAPQLVLEAMAMVAEIEHA